MRLRSLSEVASKVNAILPKESVRHRQLSIFSESLEYVLNRGSSLWLVHVRTDRIRLLVGRFIVLTLIGERVWLATDVSEDAPSFSQLPAWEWDKTSYPAYTRVPSRNGYYSPENDTGEDWEQISTAHFSFLDLVLARSRSLDPRSVRRHEPLFVKYLNQELGKEFETGFRSPGAETVPFAATVPLVTSYEQVRANLVELERGRDSESIEERGEWENLVRNGICFVPYVSDGKLAFAPSRFVGYVNNKLSPHADNPHRDGRDTNEALNRILGSTPRSHSTLEGLYLEFCLVNGIEPLKTPIFGRPRKFWVTPETVAHIERELEAEIQRDASIDETEKQALINARRGQGRFRRQVLEAWQFKCCLTGLNHESLLRASHIKPWRECTNKERLDPDNGLLLSPNMDALFDQGFISFAEDGSILISKQLSSEDRRVLGCDPTMRILLASGRRAYMAWHRENIFVDSRNLGS